MKKTATQLSKIVLKTCLLALVIGMYSCSRNDDPTPEPQPQEQKIDVYIADNEINPSTGMLDGKVYKNGELLYNYGEAGKHNLIYGLDIADGKVYASGSQILSNNGNNSYSGKIWQNQTTSTYGSGNVIITDILKSGNDTYFTLADLDNNKTQIWKNGEVKYNILQHYGVKIAVSGNDIYTCGAKDNQLVVIKNGSTLYTLSASSGEVFSFWVDGNTVYTAGYIIENGLVIAKIWKNGNELYSLGEGRALDVCVFGGVVYASGYLLENDKSVAKVWKNGNVLYTLNNGNADAGAFSVDVVGNDVYVAAIDNGSCKVWKNGDLLYLMGNYALLQGKFQMKLVPQQ